MRLRFRHETYPLGAGSHGLRVIPIPAKHIHAPDDKIKKVTLKTGHVQSFAWLITLI
jgi:hypothetical protein